MKHFRSILVCILLGGVAALSVADATQDPEQEKNGDLTDMTVDQLLNVVVTTASKKSEALFTVAAAMSVITADDIKKSGVVNIPDALRLAPGVNVGQITSQWYSVTIRGFSSRLADKLLVLIDGRSIYNNLYGGVNWEDQALSLEDIDRIEVIRGPGGTMWGANAVNGVINIITKQAKDTQGYLLQTSAGNNLNYANDTLRFGGKTKDGYYRVTAYGMKRGQTQGQTGIDSGNDWSGGRLGFRYDIHGDTNQKITLSGDAYKFDQRQTGMEPTNTAPYQQPISNLQASSGANILAKLEQTAHDGSTTTFQTFYDRFVRNGPILGMSETTLDFDFQHTLASMGKHCVMFGLGYRYIADDGSSDIPYLSQPTQKSNVYSGFLQDQVQLNSITKLTYGAKVEHYDLTGWEFEPNIRLSIQPDENHSYWLSLSRAVKTPTLYLRSLDFWVGTATIGGNTYEERATGTSDYGVGSLIAAEAGYRVKVNEHASLDIAAYHNSYDNSDAYSLSAPTPVQSPFPHYVALYKLDSFGKATTYGLELDAKLQVSNRWKLDVGCSASQWRVAANDRGYNSPGYQADILSSIALTKKLDFSQAVYFYGANSDGASAYARFDFRFAYHPSDRFELALGARNLWNKQHVEVPWIDIQTADVVKPEIYLSSTWKF